MEEILVIDYHDYNDQMEIHEKYSARAVIVNNGMLAMQLGKKGVYKLPGGTVEKGETIQQALIREVEEETGLVVDESSIVDIGIIEEVRKDCLNEKRKYICHSYFFQCDIKEETVDPHMDDDEKDKNYQLAWETLDNILKVNHDSHQPDWKARDTKFLEMVKNGTLKIKGLES